MVRICRADQGDAAEAEAATARAATVHNEGVVRREKERLERGWSRETGPRGKKCFGRRVIATCDDGAGQNAGNCIDDSVLTLRKCLFCHCVLWGIGLSDGNPGRRRQIYEDEDERIRLRERDVASHNRTRRSRSRPRRPLSLHHPPNISFSLCICAVHTDCHGCPYVCARCTPCSCSHRRQVSRSRTSWPSSTSPLPLVRAPPSARLSRLTLPSPDLDPEDALAGIDPPEHRFDSDHTAAREHYIDVA